MKVEVNDPLSKDRTYPYLGILKDDQGTTIVYFIEEETGVCLSSDAGHNRNVIGEYYTDWAESVFTPFTGSITLSND